RTNSININASNSTTYFYGVIASKPIIISAAATTVFIGGEFGSSTFTGNGNVIITGVDGLAGGSGITPSGGTYNCTANTNIACNAVLSTLSVNGNHGTTGIPVPTGTVLAVNGTDATAAVLTFQSWGAGQNPTMWMRGA